MARKDQREVSMSVEREEMPDMNEEEVQLHAEHMMQAPNLSGYSYGEVVRILTVANYVADLCIKEIEDRGMLTFAPGAPTSTGLAPIIPDARPESMFVSHTHTHATRSWLVGQAMKLTMKTYNRVRMALHPDTYQSIPESERNALCQLWEKLKR
jgi:hypothetical protein